MCDNIKLVLYDLQSYLKIHYKNRIKNILLYGSQARGDALEDSDIDILIILDGQVDPGYEIENTGDIITDVSLKYNVVISCVFISEEEFKYRNGPFLRNIRKEGIAV